MSMITDQSTAAGEAAPADPGMRMSATLSSPSLMSVQRRAAFFTVVPPTVGTAVAVVLLPWTGISGTAIGAMLAMHLVAMLGITVGYHRQFAHRAFKTTDAVRAVLIAMGSMAAEGPVIHWVSNHRRHHEFSDLDGDTHSPHAYDGQRLAWLRGMWHAHIGWMFTGAPTNPVRYARDLLRDPLVIRMNALYRAWVLLSLAIPTVLCGVVAWTWMGALQGLLWGGLVRMFVTHHATWSINSITHWYGARPYRTKEYSTNNVWLAVPSAGEAWHNCHHAFPSSARFGLEWWQLDLGWLMILALKGLGLAWEVDLPSDGAKAAKRAGAA